MKIRLFIISTITILLIFLALHAEKNYKIQKYIENKTHEHTAMYNSIYQSFKKRADIAYSLIINRTNITNIYQEISSEKDLINAREKLKKVLKTEYSILKENGTEILHFHLKDNRSLYRFQNPEKWGDDLSEIRKTVAYVNKTGKRTEGFEIGTGFSGYRFVYPIQDQLTKEHLGSVEFSFDLTLFITEFMDTLDVLSNFKIDKGLVDKKFDKQSIEKQYITLMSKEYYSLKNIFEFSDKYKSENLKKLVADKSTVKNGIASIKKGKSISIFDNKSQNLITFIPVKNPISDKICGFLTIRSGDKYIKNKHMNSYFIFICFSLFVMASAFFIYRETRNQHKISKMLREEVEKKTKELKEINENLEARVEKEVEENIKHKVSLYEKAKLASIGDMVANIAHQWRQPLSSMSTIASGVLVNKEMGILEDKQLIDYMEKIIIKTNYLSETITTFRNYIKEDKDTQEAILQERIDIAIHITDTVLKDNSIKLIKNINYDTPIYITLVVGELTQVIINIINNAKDILVEKKINDPWIKIDLAEENDKAIISIEDNGGGIPKEVLPKIFDQYFTTKDEDTGTGLGLHMSYQIITNSLNGQLYVENTSNGAKFFIELPLNS